MPCSTCAPHTCIYCEHTCTNAHTCHPALAGRFFTNYYIQPQIPILQRLAEKIKERTLPISCFALEVNRNQQKEKEKERWISKLEEKNE